MGRSELPVLEHSDALFLDFDGTLVNFASEPALVEVPEFLHPLLAGVHHKLGGAMGIVTGRPLKDLDELLTPLTFAAAGEHGAELRGGPEADVERLESLSEVTAIKARTLHEKLPGTLLEVKGASVSLHYRKEPEHEQAVIEGMKEIAEGLSNFVLIQGKFVVELKPHHLTKGTAIKALMEREPFAGRRAVFIGDDTTDEAGFEAVNELGGVSIRVGKGDNTHANHAIAGVGAVHDWLKQLD